MRHLLGLFLIFVITSPALAQHDHSQHNSTIFNFESMQQMYPLMFPPKTEPVFPPPAFQKKAPAKEETRFSFFGYRHPEMHRRGYVQLLQKLAGSQCCDGEDSGECRVTSINMADHVVLIDGVWEPIPLGLKVHNLEGFDPGVVLVCAGRRYGKESPSMYCAGGGTEN